MKIITFICTLFLFISCKKKEIVNPNPADTNLSIESFSPVSGKTGTVVTVKGKNFGAAAAYNLVTIGGINVVPTATQTTELVFAIPANISAGKHKISVKVNGITAISVQEFEVTSGSNFISTDIVPINESIVAKCFDGFGKRDVHPRLLFSQDDIQRIKTTTTNDAFAKTTYEDILSRANAVLISPLLAYGLDGANLRISNIHKICNDQIPYLVLAYQFTKDTKYAARCWQQLDAMCNYPDWGANRHFLDAGIAAKGIALAYDGLYDYLSTAQKTRLANTVKTFVLQPAKTQIETKTGVWKWYDSDDNWNGICHGGIIMAALATYETDPTFNNQIIALATNGLLKYIKSFDPDGGSEEGMSYWSYGLSNTFLALETLKRCLSTTFGLADQSGFRKTGWFPYLMSGPVGTATIGDDYLYMGKDKKVLSYFWFSHYFREANLAKTHFAACQSINTNDVVKMNGWTDLLFYDKDLINQGSATPFPLDGYLKGIEYFYVQEKNDDNTLYIGIHGGDNNASHGHLDAGSFYIQALGETWAMGNLGLESPYPADFFTITPPMYTDAPTQNAPTTGRFYYYKVRTEGKNCLIFNPDARPEQNPKGKATLVRNQADAIGGFHILDLANCYNRDVSNYKRGVKLNRQTGIITVQDEFTPLSISTVYWLMHSPATDGLVISANGKTATMTKNGKTYHVIITSPVNAFFEKVDRSDTKINYLSETAPIFSTIMSNKNSVNKPFGKLQIKMTGLASGVPATVRVDFVQTATTTVPPISGLTNWTTGN